MSSQRIRALTFRLEDSTKDERLKALSELQTIAKRESHLVAELSTQSLMEALQEQGEAEEYAEVLSVFDILVKAEEDDVAFANLEILLQDRVNVEVLLELLEHTDMTVSVTTSQLLVDMHNINGDKLEQLIQDCPDGMNKLLLRLPNQNTEVLRNQALTLLLKLTAKNVEIKKTLVFNEVRTCSSQAYRLSFQPQLPYPNLSFLLAFSPSISRLP